MPPHGCRIFAQKGAEVVPEQIKALMQVGALEAHAQLGSHVRARAAADARIGKQSVQPWKVSFNEILDDVS
ncbi:hypothetical protein [Achromobacter aegrifaciens]